MRRRTLILRTLLGLVIAAIVAAIVVLTFYVEQERRDDAREHRRLQAEIVAMEKTLADLRISLIARGVISAGGEAADEPAADEEPVAEDEPAVEEGPTATDEPAAEEEPVAESEPAVEEEPAATPEPAIEEEPAAAAEPPAEEEPTSEPEPTLGQWQDWEGSWTDSNLNTVVGYGFLIEGTSNKSFDEPTLILRCVNELPDISMFTEEILSHEDRFTDLTRLGDAEARRMSWQVFGDYSNNIGLSANALSFFVEWLRVDAGATSGRMYHIAAPNDGYVASFDVTGFEDVLAALPCFAQD